MSSRALGASASWRPRSTAVLLEARRKLPERPRRRSWVIGRSSRWLGFRATTNITQPRSAQVNSSLIFDLWALSCRRANSDDLPNLRLHNLNGLCGAQLLRFRKCQIASRGGCSRNWIEMQWRNKPDGKAACKAWDAAPDPRRLDRTGQPDSDPSHHCD